VGEPEERPILNEFISFYKVGTKNGAQNLREKQFFTGQVELSQVAQSSAGRGFNQAGAGPAPL